MMKPFGGPNFAKNFDRGGGHLPCAYCGKRIKDTSKVVSVFICCDEFQPSSIEEAHRAHGNNMGFYPLGPDCARKLRAERADLA
jgi:hypothetical protein